MDRDGLRAGHLLALAGAATVLVALWLPWFELRLGPLQRSEIAEGAGRLGAPFAAFAAGVVSALDGLRVSAWHAFGGEDVALAAGACGLALVVLAAGGAAGPQVRIETAAAATGARLTGLALAGVVVVRLVDRPLPSEVLALGPGGWVALAGCALMVVGGAFLARSGTRARTDSPPSPFVASPASPRPAAVSTSVAPPVSRRAPG